MHCLFLHDRTKTFARDPIDFRLGIVLVLDDDSLPIVLESVGREVKVTGLPNAKLRR